MILVLSTALFSCSSDEFNNYNNTDSELWDYYSEFEVEAQKRGVTIDLNSLDLESSISEISENGVAGTCQYHSENPNRIRIDKTFWNGASELLREMVVFHELGHCVLYRGHFENFNEDGICLSIMNSGLADCRVHYSESNRDLYLDELFLAE